jgi:peptide/nickel transport system substrate-binding protein
MRRALGLGLSLALAAHLARVYGATAAPRGGARAARSAAQEPPPEDLEGAVAGGTLRFARPEDSDNLDPVTNTLNVNIWILMNVYDQLIKVSPDGRELEPSLAESWDVSDDGLTYTFHLRTGIMFSDGTPMTAADVKYSLERAKNDPSGAWTFILSALQEVQTPDDNTVVTILSQPWAPWLSDVAMFNCSVISEAFASGNEARLTQEMMGTGPFQLLEWEKGVAIRLGRNPNYWEEGLPFLDEVEIRVVPEDNSRVLQVQSGEIDAMSYVPFSRLPEFEADPNLRLLSFPSSRTEYGILNLKMEPLDDVNVRLALNYATDKQALNEIVLFGAGAEPTTFMPLGALYKNEELPGFPYDLEKAREYMAQSTVPDGFSLELMYLGGLVDDEQCANALRDMWSQIGVDVQITPAEQGVYYDTWTNEEFQVWIGYWTNDIIDPDELVTFFVLPESSNAFHSSWSNAEAVELARQGPTELDPAKRQEIYNRIQEIFNEDPPAVLLYHKPNPVLTTAKVHNFQQPITGQYVWKETWLEP